MRMTDDELRTAVEEELDWDPRVDSTDIAVFAAAGIVALRGTVGAYTEKREAKLDALRVRGVVGVDDELAVALLGEYRRNDINLRQDVLLVLALNNLVPSSINPGVSEGWVTLEGTASAHFQRAEAERSVIRVRGVRGVTNSVRIVPVDYGHRDVDAAVAITAALQRSGQLRASGISVACSSGTVTLGGMVRSPAEREQALLTAWNAAGVVDVVDELRITP